MLRPRIIPVLLVRDGGLAKTVNFSDGKYVGDPLNAVRIFNEKEVDELIVLDIDATRDGREPNYKLIQSLAAECRMPLCYGGGVSNVEQVDRIVALGVEKVALSSAALSDPALITRSASRAGGQSIVVVLDLKRASWRQRYDVYVGNGKTKTGLDVKKAALLAVKAGAGEIVFNSIDNDGVMQGYDLQLVEDTHSIVDVPVTYIGGVGTTADIEQLIQKVGIVGAGAGSLFVFKGRYKAVLINYPNRSEKKQLLANAGFGPGQRPA